MGMQRESLFVDRRDGKELLRVKNKFYEKVASDFSVRKPYGGGDDRCWIAVRFNGG